MRQTTLVLTLLTASILSACGGGSATPGDQTLKVQFASEVSFGDSLSDVGSYAVGTVKALGGGKFTINGDNTAINPTLTGKNWTELMAAQFSLPAPCPAQTGLTGDASQGFSVPVVNHAGCFSYAQGGARVTNPVGPGNALAGSPLGALTVPVSTQIQNHLAAVGGKFSGKEIVFVMAGGNDTLFLLTQLTTDATAAGTAAGATAGASTFASTLVGLLAAGATNPATAAQAIGTALATENANPNHTTTSLVTAAVGAAAIQPGNSAVASPAVYGPMVASAQAAATTAGTTAGNTAAAAYVAANGPALVTAMATAGAQLANLVETQIVANGANYVTVNNLPDVATTPSGRAQGASAQALIAAMVTAFNTQLANGLANDPKVLVVDVYAVSHDQATNPAPYGLTNVTDPACDLSTAKNPLQSSLVCNASNLIPGDVSHYSFADTVHPTPFNNLLLARYVSQRMVVKGWI
ncbi:MAG TPA: esterase [Janthinobacterium sp.]|nr:esterase [Janthinobacterium sp.]